MAKDELPRPPPRVSKEPYITYWDLNRSADLMIYGYRHRITDCDPFTHDFLTAQGVQVNPQEPEPSDMYGDYRSKVRFQFTAIFDKSGTQPLTGRGSHSPQAL